jgi:dihydroxyacetone kinase DhaKLM complex PTS-EIIA-like component DhaM
MVGLLIVAHSERLASGVKEFTEQVTRGQVPIVAVGGAVDGSLGISTDAIRQGLRQIASSDGILVLVDFVSAALSVEAVLEDEPPHARRYQQRTAGGRRLLRCCRGIGWRHPGRNRRSRIAWA